MKQSQITVNIGIWLPYPVFCNVDHYQPRYVDVLTSFGLRNFDTQLMNNIVAV